MRNRIIELMSEKQIAEKRVISGAEIARAMGISRQAVNNWVNNDITSFKADTLIRLCEYFNCNIGDLLYIDRGGDSQESSGNVTNNSET